ncbi:MAG TPA: TIGR03619 family F420-dependent LLM class oxidoreductase [Steroidobacteraceae bacterium]|nr:TIGR03619 family F420-dependent LLM class oxidoreductase [Steroidobacteraceae bacterium]
MRIGVQTMHRRSEPASAPWLPTIDELQTHVQLIDACGYDSLWAGDHVAFAIPILDPLLQLAQAAVLSRRLLLGTAVYLVPLRAPGSIAKMVSSLDHLTEGRLIFGIGVGGEFPKEFELCGVPVNERGSRLTESMEVLRKIWSGRPVSHRGRHYQFSEVAMQPPPRQRGGPPMWCGGRSDAALARAAQLADGWISYVVTPAMFAESMAKIARFAMECERRMTSFGAAHLLFLRLDDDPAEAFRAANQCLSARYAMDFSKPTRRYAALGRPADIAAQARAYYHAGARHLILDFVGPYEDRDRQIERFAADVMPLIRDLTQG